MTDNENSQTISARERFLYLFLIPLLFALALITTGVFIMHQGKGASFASTIVQAGKAALSEGTNISKLAFGNKQNSAASTVSGGVQPASTGSTASQGANPSSNPAGSQPSTASNSSTATVAGSSQPPIDPSVDFKQKTDEMATVFSQMTPSQAATIIGNMSLKDVIFTMVGMKTQQRSAILVKMDPKQAASISKTLQDFPSISSSDTTAIQKQLNSLPTSYQPLDEVVKTYTQMPAQSAALLITELMKTDVKSAYSIVSNLDINTRAQLLTTMSANVKDPNSIKFATTLSEMLLQPK